MASVPVSISLSTNVISVTSKFEFVSTSFIATFKDGSQKILNRKQKMPFGLRKEADGSEFVLGIDTCSLYFKDWATVPTFGSWDKDFPDTLIPYDIAVLLPVNSILGLN